MVRVADHPTPDSSAPPGALLYGADTGSAGIPLQIAQLVERGIVVNISLKNNSPQVAGSNPALEISGLLAQLVRAFGC